MWNRYLKRKVRIIVNGGTAYDISDEKNRNNFKYFLELLKEEKILNE